MKHGFNAVEISVLCVTLPTLLNVHKLTNSVIDCLMIDAEGCDAEIIMSTNFSSLNIDHILFEHVHTDGHATVGRQFFEVMRRLNSYGYTRFKVFDKIESTLIAKQGAEWNYVFDRFS